MLQLQDGSTIYDGSVCWFEINEKWTQVTVDIEMRYGEYYDGNITLSGKIIEYCPSSFTMYSKIKTYNPEKY